MARFPGGNGSYYLDFSEIIAEDLRSLQRQATWRDQGMEFATAFRRIRQMLLRNPATVGEPLYYLSALRLHVRTVVVRPLVIDFAVDQERRVVYVQGAKLLSNPGR